MAYTNRTQGGNSTDPWYSSEHCPLVQVGTDRK